MRIWVKRGLLLCSLAALCAMLSLATLAVGYIGEDGAVGAVLRHTGGRRQDLEELFVALHDNGRQPPVYEVRYRQGGYQNGSYGQNNGGPYGYGPGENPFGYGDSWYENMRGQYESPYAGQGSWCLSMILLNMLCNCCCFRPC